MDKNNQLEKEIYIVESQSAASTVNDLIQQITRDKNRYLDKLSYHGAIVFRGFNISSREEFSDLIDSFDLGIRQGQGEYKIPRTIFENNIYTASDLAPHIEIPFHHEKPRSLSPPSYIYFYCEKAADQGGATCLCRANDIWQELPLSITDRIKTYGVCYRELYGRNIDSNSILNKLMNVPIKTNWQEALESLTTEKQPHKKHYWLKNQSLLIIETKLPGVMKHPITNELLWFNCSAYLNYFKNFYYDVLSNASTVTKLLITLIKAKQSLPVVCNYGDGKAFSKMDIKNINLAISKQTQPWHWQGGDFMIVDNFLMMHSKQPHKGNRFLYSAMT